MEPHCDIGMIGLGVMGLNLALNMAEQGFSVACYDRDARKVATVRDSNSQGMYATADLKEFISWLVLPRAVMLLVPAGSAIDSLIEQLIPHLNHGDLILDGGNSYYKDTDVRAKWLAENGIYFYGVGISGGQAGARHGPSIMPGGSHEIYHRVAPIFEAIAAQVKGEPCVSFLGPRSAGHFVKMVHNGIEYGIMQLISETYDVMKRGLGLKDDELSEIYTAWNQGELACYLLEITAQIFVQKDLKTDKRLIDIILDVAKQKGTGMWTTDSSVQMQIPTPTIDAAVSMRDLSMQEELRQQGNKVLLRPLHPFQGNKEVFLTILRQALYVGLIVTYAQGMALLSAASDKLNYHLDLSVVASIWRGGCIIRADFLEEIRNAYKQNPELTHLLFDPEIAQKILENDAYLRHFITEGIEIGIPLPAFMSVLSYLDSYRSGWLPANLIQAQRDYFGSHTYERKDEKGIFHTEWGGKIKK